MFALFFFFNDTATTEIYTLSLHDALPICNFASKSTSARDLRHFFGTDDWYTDRDSNAYQLPTFLGNHDMGRFGLDRKSTRLNSSHANISYAVFCLKKKKKQTIYYKSSQNT